MNLSKVAIYSSHNDKSGIGGKTHFGLKIKLLGGNPTVKGLPIFRFIELKNMSS